MKVKYKQLNETDFVQLTKTQAISFMDSDPAVNT